MHADVLCLAGLSGYSELTFEVPILGAGLCAANNNRREEPFLTPSRVFHFFPVRAELEKSDALYVWLRAKPRPPRSANTRRTATIPTAASRADKPFTIKGGAEHSSRLGPDRPSPRGLWAARNLLARKVSKSESHGCVELGCRMRCGQRSEMDAVAFVNGPR